MEIAVTVIGVVVAVLLWLFPPELLRRRLRIRHGNADPSQETRGSTSYEYFRGPYAFDPAATDATTRAILNELDRAKRQADETLIRQLRERVPNERLRTVNDYTFKVFRHMRFVQEKWFHANGRFFQGKATMPSAPSFLADGRIQLESGLTDQVDDWRDLGYADDVAPVQLRCDVYEGPQGHGYIVTARAQLDKHVWQNQMHVGPELRVTSQYLWTSAGLNSGGAV